MIMEYLAGLGPWAWFIIGFILLIGEVVLPGVLMIWFGLAALTVGMITLALFGNLPWWGWQAQLVSFGVFALGFVFVGIKLFSRDTTDDAASRINDPLGRFIGREAVLFEAVENGVGRVKLGDTIWRVQCATDLAAGAKIQVIAHLDGALIVEAV